MILQNLLNEEEYKLLTDKYTDSYLDSISFESFMEMYKFLKSKKVYFVNDLIINYIDIFSLNVNVVEEALNVLEERFGKEYLYYIGDNLKLLDDTIMNILER